MVEKVTQRLSPQQERHGRRQSRDRQKANWAGCGKAEPYRTAGGRAATDKKETGRVSVRRSLTALQAAEPRQTKGNRAGFGKAEPYRTAGGRAATGEKEA